MLQLILGGIGFTIWALYIIMTYYSKTYSSVNHIEVATGFAWFLVTILILYGAYKLYAIYFSGKKQIRFTFWSILGFSLIFFLILCIAYAGLPTISQSPLIGNTKISGITLFIHSIQLLLYPVFLVFLLRSLGSTIIGVLFKEWKKEVLRIQVLGDIAIGFFIFATGLLILWAIGFYNLTGLIVLILFLSGVAIPGFVHTYKNIQQAHVTYENHSSQWGLIEMLNPRLISAEIAFLVINFLIGVSLINALRPMPIGWDDLGVYMNFPKIMAMTGHYLLGTGMYAWQLITGTGFFFSYTAAQAFYVNQLGGILAVIAITSALSVIFEDPKKKYLLSLPIMFAAAFYAMPMNIFQQAKDMKLDPALLAISISGLLVLFSAWKWTNSKRDFSFLFLAWLIVGFAFSIKVTTLMLMIWGFALIAYRILSLWWFLGYFFLFLAIFTKANFWSILNVWMPKDGAIMQWISLWLVFLSCIAFFIASRQSSWKQVQHWIISSLIFLVSILAGFSPWIIKNISEVKPWNLLSQDTNKSTVLMASLLGGSWGVYTPDFTKIYSQEEVTEKLWNLLKAWNSEGGQSKNEDMGRYFWYETGINNYLKLPANLTFQKNQTGEFTEITYIFLALFPTMLLFVRWRNGKYAIGIWVSMLFFFIYFFLDRLWWEAITRFFSLSFPWIESLFGKWNNLLFGYILLLLINIGFIVFSHYLIDDEHDENKKLKEMIILFGTYGFIFLIGAFGIVWYGVLIYFILFALIGLAASSFIWYEDDDMKEKNADLFWVKATLTAIFFIFVSVYFLRSALPHGWNNFKEASYNEFKFNILSQEESIFAYRQDYVTPISTMNVKSPEKLIEESKKIATNTKLATFLASEQVNNLTARDFSTILLSLSRNKDTNLAKDARKIGDFFYKNILYPTEENANTGGIYRIGTFMTYLINQNRQRYLEDSLIFTFDTYFYDKNPDLAIDRMKKLGLKYLLVDLNAATIDKDPRHALTTRFEHLLHTMKAKNLTIVDTDNLCLRVALDDYKAGKLQTDDEFIDIAGTNYESYRTNQDWETTMIYRGQKQQNCYNYILKRFYMENVSTSDYPYLAPLKNAIDESQAITASGQVNQEKLMNLFSQYLGQSWFALFEINDTPVDTTPATTSAPIDPAATGTTSSGITTGTGK